MVTGVVSLPQQSRVAPGTPLRLPARELMKLIQGIKKSFAETGAAHGHEGTLHPAADVMRPGARRGALASVFGPNPGCATYLLCPWATSASVFSSAKIRMIV